MTAVEAIVVKDSRSVSTCQDSVTMTTTENKRTSSFAEDCCSGDSVDTIKESNAAMSTESSYENLAAIATVDNQSKSDVPEENLDAMATVDNQSKSDVPEENLDAMATVDNQSKSDVPEENLDAMATVDNQSKSDVPEENLDAMATVDNQSKSDVPEEKLDAMATVDNQSKSDVPEENLDEDKLVGNFSNSQMVTDCDSVTVCKDLTTTITKKTGSKLQDKGGNVHNFKISQEVDHIHLGHDLVNTVSLVNSEPKLQSLRKNDAEIATGIQFENIGHIEDCVAMVTVKTEPISDDLDNNSTEYEVVKHNFLLGLPQSSHIQIGLNNEDSKQLEHQSGSNLEDSMGGSLMAYRVDSDGESDAESSYNSTSATSSLESSDEEESNELNTETKINRLLDMDEDLDEKKLKKNKFGLEDIRTRGELCLDELPPIEDLHITVDEKVKLVPVGQVSSVIGCLVVVQSNMQIAPLNEDTVLFLEDRTAIGQVFEVFGPVVLPWYSFRFNSPADVENKGIKVGTPIFCAPEEENFTKYVFVNALRQLKGSDASWENNNEPPEWVREFSDDEEEKRAKQKKKNKNRNTNTKEGTEDTTQIPETKKKRNRQREKTQGVTTVKTDPDSTEFAQCQEWPPRDGGPKQGYRYSESQVNPFHNVPEQHHQDRNQHLHFAQRNRSNQWRPQTSDIRSPGFQFGGSPSFSSRFNQPFVSYNSNNCPAEFQMRGQLNDFSNIREPHSGGQMHRIGNNLGSTQVERNHSPRMGMLGQDQPPKMGNFRPNLSHMELRLTPQSEIQPRRNHFSQNQQGPLFMSHNQSAAPIGQPPFGGNRFQTEMQGPELNNNRQGTYQSYPGSNAGPHFTGPSTDRPMLGRDKGPHFTGPFSDRSVLGRDMGHQFTGPFPDRPMQGSDTGPQLMGSSPDRPMLGSDTGPQLMGSSQDRAMLGRDEGPQFTGPFSDRPMLGKDRNAYQQPFSNYGQFSNSFCASSNFNNQKNHSVEQISNRGQNYRTGNADNHDFGGPLRGHHFNQSPQRNLVDSRLIYNKNTF